MSGHLPVMLNEVVESLSPKAGGRYVDGTFGGGGYTKAILAAGAAKVLGIDRDPEAVRRGEALAAQFPGRLTVMRGAFSQMDAYWAAANGDDDAGADGVVLDLGFSSFQIDDPARGFSFRTDGPLDMRMSLEGPSAADVVNSSDEKTLTSILLRYGEEKMARTIARAIVKARPLSRTVELAELVASALGPRARAQAIHPATRTFQALRIYVNDELGELERALVAATRILAPQGRLVVVSFHSLEDRIVKRFLLERSDVAPHSSRHLPAAQRSKPLFRLIGKSARPPQEIEINANPRARSAKLRAAEKLAA